jgi:glycosyltransferase involved in cell wall biosynthesis
VNNICAIIPAYNSEKTIGTLLEKVLKFVNDVVVIDDGSVDRTVDIASGFGVNVIRHGRNFGKGRALKTGFEFAKSKNYDAVLTLDSDLQHNPEEIPKFFEKYADGFDIVIGNRMKNLKGMPIERIFSNKTTSLLI